MKKLIIYGAGVGGRETLRIVQSINDMQPTWEVLGFVDSNPLLINTKVDGYKVYAPDHDIDSSDVYAICAVMNPNVRMNVVNNEVLKKGFKLATICHPSVEIPEGSAIKEGAIIYPGVNISFNSKFGMCSMVFYNAVFGHDLDLGDYVTVLSSAVINGGCKIGSRCLIGSGANLHQCISVGDGCTIGIGTTLIESIDDNVSVMDFPRKVMTPKSGKVDNG